VFAHPDDEAYTVAGSLAKLTDEGIPATVLCFTRGEAGMIADGSGATRETLGEVREGELRAACKTVGVTDVRIVGTPDGGTAVTPDNIEAIVGAIRELRPRVVVTMEPEGVTRHPDHIAVSAMTTDAFAIARDAGDGAPSRLYYGAIPASFLDALMTESRRLGLPSFADPDDPLAPRSAPDSSIACVADVPRWVDRKAEALRAHRTQATEMIAWLPEELYAQVLGAEAFQRRWPDHVPGAPMEDDLFAAFRDESGTVR